MRTTPLLFAAMLLTIGSAWADPMPVPPGTVVEAPRWDVGSEWHYSDGYALKVTGANAGSATFERLDAPGQWFSRQGFIRKDAVTGTTTRSAIYKTVPDNAGSTLVAGKPLTFQREYMANGTLIVHASSWTVEGRETITVPAGTFDCWLIVWRTRSLKSDWTGFERWWYSPAAQNYVRMEYKYGAAPASSRVLMRLKLNSTAPANLVPTEKRTEAPQAAPRTTVAILQSQPVIPPDPPVAASPDKTQIEVTQAVSPVAPPDIASSRIDAVPPGPIVAPGEAVSPPSVQVVQNSPEKKKAIATSKLADRPPAIAQPGTQKPSAWHAQVGSSKDEAGIRKVLQRVLEKNDQLGNMPSGIYAHAIPKRGTFYRAWIGSYDSAKEAMALCKVMQDSGAACTVLKGSVG